MEKELGFWYLLQFVLNIFIENIAKETGEMEECIMISRIVYIHVTGLECWRNNPPGKRKV